MVTHNWYNGDSERNIDIGTFPERRGTTRGDPDVDVDRRPARRRPVPDGLDSVITPYLNLDYVKAKAKEFIEIGLEAPTSTSTRQHSAPS